MQVTYTHARQLKSISQKIQIYFLKAWNLLQIGYIKV